MVLNEDGSKMTPEQLRYSNLKSLLERNKILCNYPDFFLIANGKEEDIPKLCRDLPFFEKIYLTWIDDFEKIKQKEDNLKDQDVKIAEAKKLLKDNYHLTKRLISEYIDMKDENYNLIALWIMGTYFHNNFNTYPYLFLNAMRGSAKSRTLKLICSIAKEGELMLSPTEAVLFRTKGMLGIDEFEGLANKDKSSVRELLNASYKKGLSVKRMKKVSTKEGSEMIVENFEPYRPIAMANIWGMEEVLGDRCITLVLDKSANPLKTRLIEDFENNPFRNQIKDNYTKIAKKVPQEIFWCSLCSVVTEKNIDITTLWNDFLRKKYHSDDTIYTHTTLHTYTTLTTLTTQLHQKNDDLEDFFNKVHDTGIIGRSLELYMPLLIMAYFTGEEILDKTIESIKYLNEKKNEDDLLESRDILVFEFVAQFPSELEYQSIKDLTRKFREFIDYEPEHGDDWLNTKWFGKALKRLNLILDKRRMGRGIQVNLNPAKAKNQLKIFTNEVKEEEK